MIRHSVVLAVSVVVVACADDGDYPRGWSPLQAPATTAGARPDSTASAACPDLRGTYATTDQVIYGNLVARFLSREQREFDWHEVTIAARGPDSLSLRVVRGMLHDSVTVATRDVFRCADGWLTGAWPTWILPTRPDGGFDDSRGYERQLWMTRDEEGRLIGREELVSYRELPALCHGGCNNLRIPFTRREEVRWHRLSKPSLVMEVEFAPEGDAALNARLERENAALEAGTALPPR